MCEFHIPLQTPRPPCDPTKPNLIAGEYKPPIQVFLNDKEVWELQILYPKDPEFERQRGIGLVRIAAEQILTNIKNNLKLTNYIANHVKTNPKL
jgi:hypothetical protein